MERVTAWLTAFGRWIRRVFWTRRAAMTAAVVCSTVTLIGGAFAIYLKAVALDTAVWTDTSGRLLADDNIRPVVADYLVDALFDRVDVQQTLANVLPSRLDGLATIGAGTLRELAQTRANEFLERPAVQRAWRTANRNAHEQFVAAIESGSEGPVVLDLGPIVAELAADIGLPSRVVSLLGRATSHVGQVTVLRADQLDTARRVADALQKLALTLGLLTVALWILAIWLGRGRRRETVRAIAIGILLAGLVLIVFRRIVGTEVVKALTDLPPIQAAGVATWLIATAALRTVTWVFAVLGVLGMVWAWLLGPTRWAVSARRRMGPTIRDHRGIFYVVMAAIALLLIGLGPLGGLRGIVGMAIVTAIAAVGIETLRRQVVHETAGPAPPVGATASEPRA